MTVNESSVQLRNLATSQLVEAEVVLDASATVAIVTPTFALAPSAYHQLRVNKTVADTAGNMLPSTYYSYFTTE
jgi:hypothetical protein